MWNDGRVFFFQVNSDSNLQPRPNPLAPTTMSWWWDGLDLLRLYVTDGGVQAKWGRVDDEFTAKGDSV